MLFEFECDNPKEGHQLLGAEVWPRGRSQHTPYRVTKIEMTDYGFTAEVPNVFEQIYIVTPAGSTIGGLRSRHKEVTMDVSKYRELQEIGKQMASNQARVSNNIKKSKIGQWWHSLIEDIFV